MKKLIAIEITMDELQTLIIDSVVTCLKHHNPQSAPAPKSPINADRFLVKRQSTELIANMTKRDLEIIIEERLRHCLLTTIPFVSKSDNPPDNEQLLTKKQAAKLIGVCVSTIDNHARAGSLTRRYIGKSVRFSRNEVIDLSKKENI